MDIVAGVIGCGNISRFHFAGLEAAGAKVRWICDIDESAAAPYIERFDGASYAADWRRVVADSEINLVTVTATVALHEPICLAAIEAGKAVVCEKTLAANADQALRIVRAAEAKGTPFYTSYMKRFIPAVEQAKTLLPDLGRIVSTHVRAYQCWGKELWGNAAGSAFFGPGPNGMSEVRRRYGGGILVCGGSHMLDLICYLLGRPHRLYATMALSPCTDLDVQAAALLETDNGVVHYEALAHPLTRIGFLDDGWDERIEINGLDGRLELYSSAWDRVDSKASKLIHYDNREAKATEYRYGPVSPFTRAVTFFCKNIARGEQGAQSRITGYDVDELIAHITRSAQTGRALPIQWRI